MALGLAALAELLLLVTAAQKLLAPTSAARALAQIGLPVPRAAIRLGALAEIGSAAGALATGRPIFTAGVALSYTVFAAFIAVALRRPGTVSDCGCLASDAETTPTVGHLVYDVAAASVAVLVTLRPVPGLVTALGHQPLGGVPLLGLVALAGWLSWMLLSVAPQTAAATSAAAASARRSSSRA